MTESTSVPQATAPAAAAPAPSRHRHCRNCGTLAPGNYCAECGQETRVALPTLREFMREAAGRLVNFDGRLWRTLHALALRPGLLTKAYLAGRRRYYVRPARLFLAMSLIMFALIRFEVGTVKLPENLIVHDPGDKPAPARTASKGGADRRNADESLGIDMDENGSLNVSGLGTSFVGAEMRERLQRFNKLTRMEKLDQIVDGALRYGSYAVFLLLPVFAGLQYVSYLGRSRRYPGRPRLYAEHLIYAAHLHTFWFLAVIVALIAPWTWVRYLVAAWVVHYMARAKRVIYGGPWWGRLIRTIFVVACYFTAVIAAIAGLIVVSVLLR